MKNQQLATDPRALFATGIHKLLGTKPKSRDATVKVWAILTEASALASVGVIPYVLSMQAKQIEEVRKRVEATGKGMRPLPPLPLLIAMNAVQTNVMFGIVTALGLRAARSQGLGAPYLRAAVEGKRVDLDLQDILLPVAAGAGTAFIIGVLDLTVFSKAIKSMRQAGLKEPALWKRLLAIPYGTIAEEVLLRLGVQSFLSAGIRKLLKKRAVPPKAETMLPAIGIASLLFGAGHLPAASRAVPLTPFVVARILVLNSLAGVVFGYLYWKRGLESAMIAHGAADAVLHGLFASFVKEKQDD